MDIKENKDAEELSKNYVKYLDLKHKVKKNGLN